MVSGFYGEGLKKRESVLSYSVCMCIKTLIVLGILCIDLGFTMIRFGLIMFVEVLGAVGCSNGFEI